jgi:hypothetical protein
MKSISLMVGFLSLCCGCSSPGEFGWSELKNGKNIRDLARRGYSDSILAELDLRSRQGDEKADALLFQYYVVGDTEKDVLLAKHYKKKLR